MKKEVADLWVKTLRSGKYKQATRSLRSGNSFCCLGVLCDISKQGEWSITGNYMDSKEGSNDHGYLTLAVMDWSGIKNKSGKFDDLLRNLAQRNDDGESFEKIADTIDVHWEDL